MSTAPVRPYREFGAWLRSRRLARRWTQEELARRLSYGVTYVRKIEWGERRPSESFRVRLAQVLAVPPSSLPASAAAAPPGRLPPPSGALVGRDGDVAAVMELFDRGCRLVTLLGAPGIGKTRLATAVAARLDDELPGGAGFVPLADVTGPDAVPQAIGRALHVETDVGDDHVGRLADGLRSQEMLLLLDNFEHVVEAAPVVGELLARAPGLLVVVTSRQALDLVAETLYVVQPLAVPAEVDADPGRLADVASVALFTARARKVLPEFTLDGENAAVVAEICTRLQGIPLAIELAAGASRFLPPSALLAQLGPGLDLPVPGPRDAPEHQRTLRAAIGWSFDLLRPVEHGLMTRLGVFAGGCTLDAAEAVCRLPEERSIDVRATLLGLAANSLLDPVPAGRGPTRFIPLEAVRAFATESLQASGQIDRFRRRHAAWCVALVEAAEPRLTESDQVEALGLLEAEHPNVRVALAWSLEQDPGTATALCARLWRFWWIRGHVAEGRRWLDAALAGPPGDDALHASALIGAGVLARTQGAYGRAVELLEQGAALARSVGDRGAAALASLNLGIVAEHRGEHGRATALFDEARAVYESLHDERGLGHSMNCLGNVRLGAGDLEGAAVLFEHALSIFQELHDDWSVGMVLGNLGWIAHKQGRLTVARSLYEKGLTIYRALGDDRAAANTLLNLGIARQESGAGQAVGLFEEALLSLSRLGERRGVAECLEALAGSRSASDPDVAAVLLSAAEHLRERIGAPLWPDEQTLRDRSVEHVRARLGTDQFDVLWQRGRFLSEPEVLAVAVAKER